MTQRIPDMPLCMRPRERLAELGPSALSDLELLTIVIGVGSAKLGAKQTAKRVRELIDIHGDSLSMTELKSVPGIGSAKGTRLLAALEFARRRIRPSGCPIQSAQQVLPLVQYLARKPQEHLICITLNGACEPIQSRVVAIGLADRIQVHPREVFCDAIVDRACAVVLAHNHPAGPLEPSLADQDTTAKLVAAGKLLGIQVLDHVIFNDRGYFSFREEERL